MRSVLEKLIQYLFFTFSICVMAVALLCIYNLLKFNPNEIIRGLLTIVILIYLKMVQDRFETIIACGALVSISLTWCLLGTDVLKQIVSSALGLVVPFIVVYGALILAVNLIYYSNKSFWYKVHCDKESDKEMITAMLPDVYRMVCSDSEK